MQTDAINEIILKTIARTFKLTRPPVNFSYISKECVKAVKKHYPDFPKKKIQDRARYYVNKLVQKGILVEIRISKRFREFYVAEPGRLLDLIALTDARNPPENQPILQQTEEEGDEKDLPAKVYLLPRFSRMNQMYYQVASRYFTKPPIEITEEDKDNITAKFELYISDISERFLLFLTPDGILEIKPYKSRFTSYHEVVQKLIAFNQAFEIAKTQHNEGIFLTITLPPIFPLKLGQWILSFIFHRIKALLRKWHGETLPHIKVLEPQSNLNPHVHSIIFGTGFFMPKESLTKWLDAQLENFLSQLGEHYKRTINKRATEEDIKRLNKFGKRMLKRYRRYKAKLNEKAKKKGKKKRFEGLINWITKVKVQDEQWVFENPPPDYQEKGIKTMRDGGAASVLDYIKFYLISAMMEAKENEQNPLRQQKPELAFYWLLRIPFFHISPKIRPKVEKPPPAGWKFIGSIYKEQLNELFTIYV